MIKVLIVEDDPMIAEDIFGIVKRLGYQPWEPCYFREAALTALSQKVKPDIVLLDIHLNGEESGIEIAQKIAGEYQLPFIFITSFSDEQTLKSAGNTQPAGYIVKPFTQAAIYSSIEIALANFRQRHKKQVFAPYKINRNLLSPLSEREFEVLVLTSEGKNNYEISDQLFISIHTTKKHLKSIFLKLGVASRTAALAEARRLMEK